jgi:hypothetical protein
MASRTFSVRIRHRAENDMEGSRFRNDLGKRKRRRSPVHDARRVTSITGLNFAASWYP